MNGTNRRGSRSIAVVGGGFGGVGAAVMLRARRLRRRDGVRARRARRRRLAPQHVSRAPPATSRRTCTSSRSRRTRAGRAATRRRPRSRPTSRTSRAATACSTASAPAPRSSARAGTSERGTWVLETSAGPHEADVLITACGQLSVPSVPPIPGLDSFAGPAFHTAQLAPRRRPRRQARGGGRHRLQRDPGRAGDPADRRAASTSTSARRAGRSRRWTSPTRERAQAAVRALPGAAAARPRGDLRLHGVRRGRR